MKINKEYNKALTIYDNLSDKLKMSFKEYVLTTWEHLNPPNELQERLSAAESEKEYFKSEWGSSEQDIIELESILAGARHDIEGIKIERDQLRTQLASFEAAMGQEPVAEVKSVIRGLKPHSVSLKWISKETPNEGDKLYLQPSPNKADVPSDVAESLAKLDRSYYRVWAKENPQTNGWIAGNINTVHLVKVIEWVRSQLPPLKDEG